jgi:hypothetical protein
MAGSIVESPVSEVIEFFAHAPSQEDIVAFRLSSAALRRLREVLAGNAAGTLTADEQHKLDQMVLLDDILSLIRTRAQGSMTTTART